MTETVRKTLRRRPVAAALRLALIAAFAAALAGLTFVAAPAHAGGGARMTPPVGEETRGNDYAKDWKHCVQVVANLRAKPPKVPVVILLGGSSAREATVHDDDWTQQIKRRSGFEVQTYNLGSKHRSYAQDLAFVKLLPRRVKTIVYIGINLGRFCIRPGFATVHLPRPARLRYYPQHVYSRSHIQSASEKRYYVGYWLSARQPEFNANYASELNVLAQLIRVAKSRGLHVALVDLPRDLPAIGSAFNGPVGRYSAGCAALSRRFNVPWLHFVGSAHFVDTDFFDIFHLVEPGREKYQSILSDKTIGLIKKYHLIKPPSPTPSPSPSPTTTATPTASPSSSASPSASPVASH